ncbi:TPA: hypothetical protein U1W10_001707 [Streptococcus suis]|nr:hypothetical protein [Streptococcus suis]
MDPKLDKQILAKGFSSVLSRAKSFYILVDRFGGEQIPLLELIGFEL